MQSEYKLQANCFQYLWNNHPETRRCFFHVPNGGKRSLREAMTLKSIGVVPGIPDMIFAFKGKAYFFEFKAEKGKISPEQEKAHLALQKQGFEVYTVKSFDAFKGIIDRIITKVTA